MRTFSIARGLAITATSIFLLPASLALAAPPELGGAELHRSSGPRLEGEYLVALRDGVKVPSVTADLVAGTGGRLARVWRGGFRGLLLEDVSELHLSVLLRHPKVRYVEENAVVTAAAIEGAAVQADAEWNLDRIDQRALPLSGTYTYDFDGSGVHAYILDSGIRLTHTEFEGRASADHDVVGDGAAGLDCNGHGTHVAAVLGGRTFGVAKGVRLHSVRVLGCDGFGTLANLIDAVEWVTANHQAPAVVNLSLEVGGSPSLDEAVEASAAAGLFYVAAAGNGGVDACYFSPGRSPAAYSVGAVRRGDQRASYSNHGPCVDLFAPGSTVLSASHEGDAAVITDSGTSVAAPHVAGAAALILDRYPTAPPAEVRRLLEAWATPGALIDAGSGSPNLLLHSLDDGSAPPPSADLADLPAGVPGGLLSGRAGDELHFHLDLPPGKELLRVEISGGEGDADLYLRHGAAPTLSDADCRPYLAGNEESCAHPSPEEGRWCVMLHSETGFAGVSLRAEAVAEVFFRDGFESGGVGEWMAAFP